MANLHLHGLSVHRCGSKKQKISLKTSVSSDFSIIFKQSLLLNLVAEKCLKNFNDLGVIKMLREKGIEYRPFFQ